MSDWEADDFDPSSQVADKVVALGLDVKRKLSKTAEKSELTEAEKVALQKQSDADIGAELLGIRPDTKKSWDTMRKAVDFADYAEELAEQIMSNRDHPQYLYFVNTLFAAICKPMTKLQLESVMEVVNSCLVPLKKKEEELKKRQEEEKAQLEEKKNKEKALYEDIVQDEYDDYDAKYYA